METSDRIKARQYHPIEPVRSGEDWAEFESETRERVTYMARRTGRTFKCGCPATGLCKHVTWLVLRDARRKFRHVSLWTSEADARAQHRRVVEAVANKTAFWITLAGRIEPTLDERIDALGQEHKALQRAICPENGNHGQWWADRRKRLEELRQELMALERQRQHRNNERLIAARRAA